MLQGMTIVVESKQFTWSLLDFFNHCLYQDANGKRLVWISSLDFPLLQKNFNSIWVIVDRLTKSTHFMPVRTDYRLSDYAELYFNQIVCLHGVLGPLYLTEDLSSLLILGTFAQDVRHQLSHKFCLSSTNLRTDRAGESNIGRHVKSLSYIFQKIMG